MPPPILLSVAGPTASGKSALALALAQALNGEIVSCDSMQVYRGMNIGTAKPTQEEQRAVPHHMIDICDPTENYSCAQYVSDACAAIADILARGRLPIVCGGTGLYLQELLAGGHFAPDISEQVLLQTANMPIEEAYDALLAADPEAAASIPIANERRVRRALAIFYSTGKTKTEWDRLSRMQPPAFRSATVILTFADRSVLYRRIEERVDEMMRQGLLEEARSLALPPDCTAAQAIGYKELYRYLNGEGTLDDAVAQIKLGTRRYAKRQMTWFRTRAVGTCLDPSVLSQKELIECASAALDMARREENTWI